VINVLDVETHVSHWFVIAAKTKMWALHIALQDYKTIGLSVYTIKYVSHSLFEMGYCDSQRTCLQF